MKGYFLDRHATLREGDNPLLPSHALKLLEHDGPNLQLNFGTQLAVERVHIFEMPEDRPDPDTGHFGDPGSTRRIFALAQQIDASSNNLRMIRPAALTSSVGKNFAIVRLIKWFRLGHDCRRIAVGPLLVKGSL